MNVQGGMIVACAILCGTLGVRSPLAAQTEPGKDARLKEVLTIGDSAGGMFAEVGDIAVDGAGNIYITDRWHYTIKKFSPQGRLLTEYAKSGNGSGAFASGPARIEAGDSGVAVSDLGTAKIVLLTGQLLPRGELEVGAPVVDMARLHGGRLCASVLPPHGRSGEILASYALTGAKRSDIPLRDPPAPMTLQVTWLCSDRSNGMVAAYAFCNRVMVYDARLRLAASFAVPGLPDDAPLDTIASGDLGVVPKAELIRSIAVSPDSLIFLLGGDFSPHPGRDVYLLDYRGDLRGTLLLPRESGLIYIDDRGFLYVRERHRTEVRKYHVTLGFPFRRRG